jgi:glycosyltransferase involved in cell wall biosynthesis
MKTCHVITSLDIGGAELVLSRLLQAQADNKEDILVVSLTTVGKLGEQLRGAGFTVISLGVNSAFSLLTAVIKLRAIFKQYRPAVIQSWLYHADFVASLSAVLANSPRVFWGIHTCQLPAGKPVTWLIMKCCALMSYVVPRRIVCVAEASRQLHIANGYNAAKITVIPNGFQLCDYIATAQQRQDLRKKYGFSTGIRYVGIIGRWHPDKGQDIMFDAIQLLQKNWKDVAFVFVGRGCEPANPEFASCMARNLAPAQIMAWSERSDIPDILKALDLFCLPSRTEAFPLALGEAMCAGLPVVATDVGDVRYMLGDVVSPVTPGNAAELADGLAALLAQTELQRQQIGAKLCARAATLFSIESMVQRYQQLYDGASVTAD